MPRSTETKAKHLLGAAGPKLVVPQCWPLAWAGGSGPTRKTSPLREVPLRDMRRGKCHRMAATSPPPPWP